MKIGMNSQTLRMDLRRGIIDYHITDGLTASYMMKAMRGEDIEEALLKSKYPWKEVSSTDDMTWGTDKDKMNNINTVDTNDTSDFDDDDDDDRSGFGYGYGPYYSTQFATRKPVRRVLRKQSGLVTPQPAKDYSDTDENAKNFGNLFGN